MMKHKYLLDADNLVFQKELKSLKTKIKSYLAYVGVGVFLAFLVWGFLFKGLLNSPKNYILHSHNERIINDLSELNMKFDSVSAFLSQIQHRDDNFYRVVSEIEPISESRRAGGFGGTDKYKDLSGFKNSKLLIESAKKGDILESKLRIQSQSYDTVIYFAKQKHDSLLAVPGIAPVAPADYHRISDRFGRRVHPITKKVHKHTGIDFAARQGMPIHSAGNGKVVRIRKSHRGYGNQVKINHGYGFETLYAHMQTIDVKVGDVVTRGQKIGTVGNTGTSTGPHLHYEVIYNKIRKNPEYYYIEDLTDEEYEQMIHLFTASN